jgi:hypothetical protein
MFNVGDKVWCVSSGTKTVPKLCPDCLGQKALTVILGDGTQVSIDCDCCEHGWQGSSGYIDSYEWTADILPAKVTGMEIDGSSVRYKVDDRWYVQDVFATQEQATLYAATLRAEYEKEEAERITAKVKRNKNWAWCVTYHRRGIAAAKKNLAYHEAKLAVAKAKAKDKTDEPVP